jgi:2'-5' RNA ligase
MNQAAFRRRKEIVWAQPSETPPALAGLAAGLRAALGEAGFLLENRPFAAHVTLLRKSRGGKLPRLPAADWPVVEFSLTRSVLGAQGARYESLQRFACAA